MMSQGWKLGTSTQEAEDRPYGDDADKDVFTKKEIHNYLVPGVIVLGIPSVVHEVRC